MSHVREGVTTGASYASAGQALPHRSGDTAVDAARHFEDIICNDGDLCSVFTMNACEMRSIGSIFDALPAAAATLPATSLSCGPTAAGLQDRSSPPRPQAAVDPASGAPEVSDVPTSSTRQADTCLTPTPRPEGLNQDSSGADDNDDDAPGMHCPSTPKARVPRQLPAHETATALLPPRTTVTVNAAAPPIASCCLFAEPTQVEVAEVPGLRYLPLLRGFGSPSVRTYSALFPGPLQDGDGVGEGPSSAASAIDYAPPKPQLPEHLVPRLWKLSLPSCGGTSDNKGAAATTATADVIDSLLAAEQTVAAPYTAAASAATAGGGGGGGGSRGGDAAHAPTAAVAAVGASEGVGGGTKGAAGRGGGDSPCRPFAAAVSVGFTGGSAFAISAADVFGSDSAAEEDAGGSGPAGNAAAAGGRRSRHFNTLVTEDAAAGGAGVVVPACDLMAKLAAWPAVRGGNHRGGGGGGGGGDGGGGGGRGSDTTCAGNVHRGRLASKRPAVAAGIGRDAVPCWDLDRPMADVARALGISLTELRRRWRQQAVGASKAAPLPPQSAVAAPQQPKPPPS